MKKIQCKQCGYRGVPAFDWLRSTMNGDFPGEPNEVFYSHSGAFGNEMEPPDSVDGIMRCPICGLPAAEYLYMDETALLPYHPQKSLKEGRSSE